jgi:hypothetical protein
MRTRHRSMLVTSALLLGALGSSFLGLYPWSASSHR